MPKLTKDDKRWRAQEDARSMARAEEVKGDKPRLTMAKAEAKRQAQEEMKSAKAMQQVAKTKPAAKPAPKRSAGRRKKR